MKEFKLYDAKSYEEASKIAKETSSEMLAGGTDIISVLKDKILENSPESLVSIKNIQDGCYINDQKNSIEIGALTKLTELAESEVINSKIPILAEAAVSVATPIIRNVATVGGNICQDVRCWYYRYPHDVGGRIDCLRKGGDTCYALQGDSRYHSISGGMKAGTTGCTQHCPASVDVPGYLEQIRIGNDKKAAMIFMRSNPMPMITSRVCAHFCQEGCSRCSQDESVANGVVAERYIGDYVLENYEAFFSAPETENGKKVAIIGSGPSGLSAAYYLRKAGHDVTVYDTKKEAGGMLMYAIPNYRLPKSIVRKYVKCLENMGIHFIMNTTVGKDLTPAVIENKFDSVYYATGAWKRPIVGIAGEKLTEFGLDFLIQVNEWMKGKVGSNVLVTGGGNVAMDVAITAKRLGAEKVTLACLECESDMPASKEEIARAKEEGVIIMPSWGLSKVVEENGVLKGMELKKCTAIRDEDGAFNPQYDNCELTVIPAQNILMCIGQKVDVSFLDEKYQMQLTNRGLIEVADETQMTSRKGVFAGGDATTGPATAVLGVANGRKAAFSISHYLDVPATNDCKGMFEREENFLSHDQKGILKKADAKLEERSVTQRNIEDEDTFSLDVDKVREEAARCLNCGCYAVNPSDIGPALICLNAKIITTDREIPASEFFSELRVSSVLKNGEIVKSIEIPVLDGAISHYDKFRIRDSIDFAIVSLASMYSKNNGKITGARLVYGGVAPTPIRDQAVERFLIGKEITEEVAEAAGEIAVRNAMPFEKNSYKVQELRTVVKRSVLRLK